MLCALLAFTGACTPSGPAEAPAFFLRQVRPKDHKRVGVFLNEALHFNFSADVDPTSVTRESIVVRRCAPRVQGEPGGVPLELAAGSFQIRRNQVTFLPDLGCSPGLLDGGFLPGAEYEVILRGFPLPDGLRSVDGRILNCTYAFRLETVSAEEPAGQLFDDERLGQVELLKIRAERPRAGESPRDPDLEGKSIPPLGPLYLTCAKPLDPRSVKNFEFELISVPPPEDTSDQGRPQQAQPRRRMPLRMELIENTRDRGAVLELSPQTFLEPGEYHLHHDQHVSIRDYGNNEVLSSAMAGAGSKIVVSDTGGTLVETFLDSSRSSSLPVPGVDGTACWSGNGVVSIRYPRAAGDGSDGTCVLTGPFGGVDLQATRLTVESGSRTELLSAPGTVCLRAQGLLRVHGALSRRCGDGAELSFTPGETLSAWLERARSEDLTVTVLIAGGDLVIEGEIEVEGPLVLVAGGRIRATGPVQAQKDQLWLVGDGGGPTLDLTRSRAGLVIDPPHANPLVETLTFCTLSGPMPSEGSIRHWTRAEVEQRPDLGAEGNTKVKVFYVGEDYPAHEPVEQWGLVDDPALLPISGPLRLLLWFEVGPPNPAPPGGDDSLRWNPPVIDEVRLFWEPRSPSGR